jgi:hypothetical protein
MLEAITNSRYTDIRLGRCQRSDGDTSAAHYFEKKSQQYIIDVAD